MKLPALARYVSAISIVLLVPVSPNYNLRELQFGQASGGIGQSASFQVEGSIGDISSALMNGSSVNGGLGFGFTQMANVPPAPTLTNPANYYNKLQAIVDQGDNPSDTLFAIAISDDNFATTNYVKQDQTVGNTLDLADYQSYAAWGGGSGFDIIGLQPSTTYAIKVKAFQGDFTESAFGPSDDASTVSPSLSFDLDVSATDADTDPPYTLSLGSLIAGSITTGTNKIWIDLETNANSGGKVYIYADGPGLTSASQSFTITSATADLASVSSGFGAQIDSVAEGGGGPLTETSPYDGGADNVGVLNTVIREIFDAAGPVIAGRGSIVLKAKSASLTPSADDYSSILTLIASANF